MFTAFSQKPGKERWGIKTLNDPLAPKIDTNYLHVFIKTLSKLPSPTRLYYNTGRTHQEMKTFTIVCIVKEAIKEEDGDYHLIVVDTADQNSTMIVEVINPHYGSAMYYKSFTEVREALLFYKRKKILIGKMFTITGVAFFDLPHNQKGAAQNYIELHPVLKFTKL